MPLTRFVLTTEPPSPTQRRGIMVANGNHPSIPTNFSNR